MNTTLDSLARAYARLSRDVGGRIDFACDLDNDEAFNFAESEKIILDQAFFVISFAALENLINDLACTNIQDGNRQTAMRSSSFPQRWDAAVKVAFETLGSNVTWREDRQEILNRYDIRSDIAHGRVLSKYVDVANNILLADKIATTLDQVIAARRPVS